LTRVFDAGEPALGAMGESGGIRHGDLTTRQKSARIAQ
jgi:hypothetical protein